MTDETEFRWEGQKLEDLSYIDLLHAAQRLAELWQNEVKAAAYYRYLETARLIQRAPGFELSGPSSAPYSVLGGWM